MAAAAAAAPAGGGGQRQAFTGRGPAELGEWLRSSGVDVARYGTAAAKTLDQLW